MNAAGCRWVNSAMPLQTGPRGAADAKASCPSDPVLVRVSPSVPVSARSHLPPASTMYRRRPLRTARLRWRVDQTWTRPDCSAVSGGATDLSGARAARGLQEDHVYGVEPGYDQLTHATDPMASRHVVNNRTAEQPQGGRVRMCCGQRRPWTDWPTSTT